MDKHPLTDKEKRFIRDHPTAALFVIYGMVFSIGALLGLIIYAIYKVVLL